MVLNVLLINPSQKSVYGNIEPPDYPPLGLGYIAAVLEQAKHSVKILDIDAEKIGENELIAFLRDFKPKIVGFTATTPTFYNAAFFAEIVKKNFETKTVLGGIHATILPMECLSNPNFDFVVFGEGEITMLELAALIEKGENGFSDVLGLGYKKGNELFLNNRRPLLENLDSLPFPARHLFNHKNYNYPDSLFSPTMPILTSRGCPGLCNYCCTKLIYPNRIRTRSAKNIVDEIEMLIRDYGIKELHIWDDNFTLIKRKVFELKEELARRKIKIPIAFPNGLRVDKVNDEVLRALKEMGTYSVAFGIESGNQKVLNLAMKGTTLEQIRAAVKSAKKTGLEVWGFFMVGLLGDTRETIEDTINLAIELDVDIAKFHVLKPFPGTKVFEELDKQGLIIEKDYSKYGIHTGPVHRLPTLSQNDLLELQKRAYNRFYLRPKKMLKQIIRIKSFNRLKLNAKAGFGILKVIYKGNV